MNISEIKQKQNLLPTEQPKELGFYTLVKFSVAEKFYAVNIKNVHEILESVEFTPYPKEDKKHIGIINVRGVVIPLVQFDCVSSKKRFDKVIILEYPQGKLWAIGIHKVQKVNFKAKFIMSGQTINLNGTPVYYLDEKIFEEIFKEK